ncbi:hypothetical protein PI125_g23108 [Phytophthora idaei]|nr:hypothetical protein PI125_g23108 [Phytophthora idaei]
MEAEATGNVGTGRLSRTPDQLSTPSHAQDSPRTHIWFAHQFGALLPQNNLLEYANNLPWSFSRSSNRQSASETPLV